MRIASILDTNAFEIRPFNRHGSKVRAVFLEAAMLSHNCVPNTRHVFDKNMQMTIHANGIRGFDNFIFFIFSLNPPSYIVDIAKDQIICLTYTQPLKCTLDRRDHLKVSKCFDCQCERCSDASELGTYCGAIICVQCKNGYMRSADPLDRKAPWECPNCLHRIQFRQVVIGNKSLSDEIDKLNKKSPMEFERFLDRYSGTLHARNTYTLQVKYALVQLYGNVAGFYLNGTHMRLRLMKRRIQDIYKSVKICRTD